ncbi:MULTISPECIES: SRPBCC family protein [Streptomyces]|uniref:SRPBCC family protein n=1 Tax=Streptomyces glycanivorans TaxID=3033808 RepID=A0ABY9J5D7_9ACTN|nr:MULTISPECIES: SRPBCC family protein [unclassified Streptomyces]WSQ76565.1 SRPBCC family protein [Streptomyces sp. NBC_01213]TXS20192.1 SRPBCC family protein [Streptomyces sp. wa22]WLQ63052.1 SRPBCC family protein [Streptomyces sp. Alt3]WSQ83895.1 SRPBCC family protein [Streptomyces sp. NBC_01212]WSR10157.1 SRPBCC family protein [Streptomyces sp. NBC_01208]
MAVRHRLIRKSPEDVWRVLSDAERYGDWVVGTSRAEPDEGRWPEVGAALRYEIALGPLTLHNRTVVRRSEPTSVLELEADSGRLGTARIAMELRPWGENTLLIFDEHPLRGAGGALHNGLLEVAQQVRHRAMLGRLARLCEDAEAGQDAGNPLPRGT